MKLIFNPLLKMGFQFIKNALSYIKVGSVTFSDNVEFKAGSGVELSVNESEKSITINSTSGKTNGYFPQGW